MSSLLTVATHPHNRQHTLAVLQQAEHIKLTNKDLQVKVERFPRFQCNASFSFSSSSPFHLHLDHQSTWFNTTVVLLHLKWGQVAEKENREKRLSAEWEEEVVGKEIATGHRGASLRRWAVVPRDPDSPGICKVTFFLLSFLKWLFLLSLLK